MPIRNPFGRRLAQDENARDTNGPRLVLEPPGFERVDTVGSKASSLNTASSRSRDTGAYKLSGTALRLVVSANYPRHQRRETPSSALVAPVANPG